MESPGNQADTKDQESLILTQDTQQPDIPHCVLDTDHTDIDVHEITSEALKIINSVSVFSIGPFPASSVSTLSLDTSNQFDKGIDSSCGITVFGTQDKLDQVPSEEVDKSVVEDEKSNESSSSVPTSVSTPETSTLDPSTPVMSTPETLTPETSTSETTTATASDSNQSKPTRTPEEVLASRAARLKRLEEQADWLMKKMSATSRRGSVLSTRLEELHEAYGEPPAPPPMPDVLPSVTLPSFLNTNQVIYNIPPFL